MGTATKIRAAARDLSKAVDELRFGAPVTHVYNPLDYAWRAHSAYIGRFGDSKKRVVFVGMNPGPFGMAQTGVPFGEIGLVRDWMGIEAKIGKPAVEHPKRPIDGFACTRSEVSGARLWGAIAERWKTPERFFADHYVANYCPLLFMEESGRNRTPDKLPAREKAPLGEICDKHLRRIVEAFEPEWLVGVGAFAEKRAHEVCGDMDVKIGRVLHPSPASPKANKDWIGSAKAELRAQGICG